jgi:translocator protein
MKEKIRQILVPIATSGVIFVNYLAAAGKINNVSPEVISDKYPTIITPAGFAFSIWGLIYFGMIAFSIYQLLPAQTENQRLRQIRTVYILNCAANCAWIYLWHHEVIVGAFGVICLLLATLVFISVKLRNAESTAETWLAKIPFSIYFGWVTVATILNFSIALVYLGLGSSGTTEQIFGAILAGIAVVLGVLIRFKFKLYAYPLVVAWALTAIAANHGGATIIVVTCAIGVIILLIASLSFVIDMNSTARLNG